MSNTLKFGNGEWAVKEGSTLAYNDTNGNYKPLPFTFDRAGSATRVNKQGLIEVVSNNEPRIDFLNDSKGAFLLEPSRTNLIPFSENFNGTGWNVFGSSGGTCTRTLNYGISPQGIQNSTRVVFSGGDTALYFNISISVASTATIYVKGVAGEIIGFGFGGVVSVGSDFTFNGEWQRLVFSGSSGGFVTINTWSASRNARDFEIYGAQLEQGSYATSYIPTQGGIGTRVAEQGIDGGAGSPIFSNTSAVWFIDLERIGVDTDSSGSAMALRNSSFSQQIRLHFDAPTSNIRFRDGLNGFATISTITGMSAGVRKKIALRIDGSTLSTFANGSKIGSDYTAPSTFDISEIDFATLGFKIHDMRFNNTALTDQELINLTTI